MKMKNLASVFVSYFVLFFSVEQSKAYKGIFIEECLEENGFQRSDYHILLTVGKPHASDYVQALSNEKIACVIACAFKKDHPEKSLYEFLENTVLTDHRYMDDKRKEMMNTLIMCKPQAGDNDCKLLHCLKVTEAPFYDIAFKINDIPPEFMQCFLENGIEPVDVQYIDKLESQEALLEILKKIDEEKLLCSMSCIYNLLQAKIFFNQTLQSLLVRRIYLSNKITEVQKKKILETIDKCGIEAKGDNCKLLKCVKVLRPPFIQLFINN